jgi:uncharacterized damage-inducible protein DinB
MASPLLLHYAAYNKWANVRVLNALREIGLGREGSLESILAADASLPLRDIRSTLNHILAADALWYSRFTGADVVGLLKITSLRALWAKAPGDGQWSDIGLPDATLETLSAELCAQSERWIALAAEITETDAASMLRYIDTEGAAHDVPRASTLLHVFNHATHHRGQISAAVTALGARPLELDMIYFARTLRGSPEAAPAGSASAAAGAIPAVAR